MSVVENQGYRNHDDTFQTETSESSDRLSASDASNDEPETSPDREISLTAATFKFTSAANDVVANLRIDRFLEEDIKEDADCTEASYEEIAKEGIYGIRSVNTTHVSEQNGAEPSAPTEAELEAEDETEAKTEAEDITDSKSEAEPVAAPATEAVTEPTEPVAAPETEAVTEPTEPVAAPETEAGTEPTEPVAAPATEPADQEPAPATETESEPADQESSPSTEANAEAVNDPEIESKKKTAQRKESRKRKNELQKLLEDQANLRFK